MRLMWIIVKQPKTYRKSYKLTLIDGVFLYKI